MSLHVSIEIEKSIELDNNENTKIIFGRIQSRNSYFFIIHEAFMKLILIAIQVNFRDEYFITFLPVKLSQEPADRPNFISSIYLPFLFVKFIILYN